MLERSFYSHLRIINDRSIDVRDSNTTVNTNHIVAKVFDQEIGQGFIKRIDNTRLIVTVAPAFIEQHFDIEEEDKEEGEETVEKEDDNDKEKKNSSQDSLQPLGRSRANTWHYTKRGVGQSVSSLCAQPQENSINYYRTMSVGSKPYYSDTADMIDKLRLEHGLCSPETIDQVIQSSNKCLSNVDGDFQNFPTNLYIEVYDCRQEDVENVLLSDKNEFDHTIVNNFMDDSSSCSCASTDSDEYEEEHLFISSRKKIIFDEPGN